MTKQFHKYIDNSFNLFSGNNVFNIHEFRSNKIRFYSNFSPFKIINVNLSSGFTEESLNHAIHKIISEFNNTDFSNVFLILKGINNNNFYSLSDSYIYSKGDLVNKIVDYLFIKFNILDDYYHTIEYNKIYIEYYFFNSTLKTNDLKLRNHNIHSFINNTNEQVNKFRFGNLYFPLNNNYNQWGNVIFSNQSKILIEYKIRSKVVKLHIEFQNDITFIKLISNNINIDLFCDQYTDSDILIRKYKNNIYYIQNGIVIKQLVNKKVNFLKNKDIDPFYNNKIITYDIETYFNNNQHIPYACGFFDGQLYNSFYLTDYNSPNEMLIASIKALMIRKYKGYHIYIHNLSGFDGVFLLKNLAQLGKLNIIMRNNKIIKIVFNFQIKNSKISITFNDSYMLLPSSLDKLSKMFDVDNKKTYFPHHFVHHNNLNYIGIKPNYEYYKDIINIDEYNNIPINNWNLKNELLSYLKFDCLSLYQIISKYSNIIYYDYRINVLSYPTLPSLAFSLFRSRFLANNNIPLINSNMENDIWNAYYGGIVDVYKPYGENLYYYDINSLYPYAMLKDMPIGSPTFIRGQISLEESFGFFLAEIETPKNIHIPVIPIKENGKLICPKGKWKGWYFSEELKESLKYGYKVKLIEGYQFNKGKVFKEYVNHFYNKKVNSNGIERNISKLFLNSLYGRFGMNEILEDVKIINKNQIDKFIDNYIISDIIDFNDGNILVKYKTEKKDFDRCNRSVAIAAAITAYARMEINKYKHIEGNECLYSDTDSVVLEKPLPDQYIGNNIGQMKLEYSNIKEGVFIGPKVYSLKLDNLNEITKIKGYSKNVEFNEMKKLLEKDYKISLKQNKWNKYLDKGVILINEQTYLLTLTSLKREVIYLDNIFVNTKPYNI